MSVSLQIPFVPASSHPVISPASYPVARAAPTTDGLGCTSSRLSTDRELRAAGITLYRKRSDDLQLGQVQTPPTDRGLLVGLSMRGGHRRRILHAHHACSHDFEENSIYVRSFSDAYRADMRGGFDFMLLEISSALLDQSATEAGCARVEGLSFAAGRQDPVLVSLMRALMAALERPREASTLFLDQVGAAITTHLVGRYGGLANAPTASKVGTGTTAGAGKRIPTLSRQQASLAKEILLSRIDGDISITEVAGACKLSRAYFTRAFKETTGQTPHRWLLAQRVDRACSLLWGSRYSVVEIASLCGFADQSHLTRVFTQLVGTPPGKWRRAACG